jgi:iron complex outermembrane receptor protein
MIVLCIAVNAQSRISGVITDGDSIPLPGAFVYVPEANKGTITDENGKYELSNLPKGKIRIQFSYIGHTSKIESVISTGANITLNITLEASAIEADEIVVSAGYNSTQHENAVKIDALKLVLSEIKSSPNFMEIITKIPGVDMISKGNGVSKPVIRGLSMNDILVLNNGVRFENYQYSSHHPLGIDEFGIEDIEVIKGPASLLYGSDAIGGIINFIKEKPAPENSIAGNYSIQLFSNSLGILNNFGIKGASRKFFGGIRGGQKSHADYLQGGGNYVPNTRFNEYALKTNFGYTDRTGTFKIFYDFNRQNLGLAEEEAIEQITERSRSCNIFYQQLNTHLLSSQNKLYFGKLKLDVNSAFQNTELIHIGEKDEYEIQMNLATFTYETKLYLPSDKHSEYIIGFQGINQSNSNTHNRDTKLLPDAKSNNFSVFGLLQRTFFGKLKVQTGLRYDYKTIASKAVGIPQDISSYRRAIDKHYGSLSGSLGATYAVSEKLLFRANVATAYRTPNLAELTSNGQHENRYEVGDQKLNPEVSFEADLSLHYHQSNLTFDIAGFNNNINRYIFISPTGDTTNTGISMYKYNQSNSRLYGGEAGLHIHPEIIEWLHFVTTFSSVIGKQKNGNYLPFIPAHKINMEFRAEKEKLSFLDKAYISLNTTTSLSQNNAAPDETATNGYTLVDMSIGGKLKAGNQHMVIGISAHNIFDKRYVDHLSTLKEVNFYNPGRNIVFILQYQFGHSLHANGK